MKILIISENINYLDKNHPDFLELFEFAEYLEQLHVIVLNVRKPLNIDQTIDIGGRIFVYPVNYINPLSRKKIFFDIVESNLKWLKKIIVDLVISEDLKTSSYYAFELSQKYKVPFVIKMKHDFDFDEKPDSDSLNIDYEIIITGAGGVGLSNEKIKNKILSLNPSFEDKIFYLEDYVDFENIDKKEVKVDLYKKYPNAGFVILLESNNTETSFYESIFKGIKNLNDNNIKSSLILLGKNKNIKKITNIGEHILGDKFFWEESRENLYDYLKHSNLFVLSKESGQFNKQIVVSILSGCPVLTEDEGLAKTYIDQGYTGYLFDAEKEHLDKVITKTVIDIIRDPNIRDKILISYRKKLIDKITTNKDEYYQKYIKMLIKRSIFTEMSQKFYEY